jgi:hypothetical protein
MRLRGIPCNAATSLLLGILLTRPGLATAQHHGGHGGPGSIPGGSGRPTGVEEKDTLKDFHQAMAVQATSQQITEFHALVKISEAAKVELQTFLRQRDVQISAAAPTSGNTKLDEALNNARGATKKFVEGFSATQKSGLKEATKRLNKAESSLEEEEKKLDQAPQTTGADMAARAQSLDLALTELSNQQLALGREMGIVLANGQDLTFNLPVVKSTVNVAGRPVAVSVSGTLSQTAAEGSQRTFKLELLADLSDLQSSITELLRAQFDQSNTCRERVTIRQAMLVPSTPASVLTVQLHFERWVCSPTSGPMTDSELAEADGAVNIKVSPAGDPANPLKLSAEFQRIDASGMLGEALRSGDLGDSLRDKVTRSVLSVVKAAADLKATLPPAVQGSAILQTMRFQDSGVGRMNSVLTGQVQISNEQANLLASQLNQTLSAQGAPR